LTRCLAEECCEEAQVKTEQALAQLTDRVGELAKMLAQLIQRIDRMDVQLGDIRGKTLAIDYRERAAGFFQGLLRNNTLLGRRELEVLAEQAETLGRIDADGHRDLLLTDGVLEGIDRIRGDRCYLAIEVSATIAPYVVERAKRRAAVLEIATGTRTLAAVAGAHISDEARQAAQQANVRIMLNGREAHTT
jgi:hypothetical protein